jgi:uncharacterized protein
MTPSLVAPFATLTLALACLWAPRITAWPHASRIWIVPGALALILALVGGVIDPRGLAVLLAFAAACISANRASGLVFGIVAHATLLAIGAGLFLHVMPGIDNPRVVTDVVLGPGAMPYTKYLNFDKGMAGLFLLGLYAPDRPAQDEGVRHIPGFLWRFALVVIVAMVMSLARGYVRWDPKLPSWWPMWVWSMIFLTALPEEAAFRGVAQTWIAQRLVSTSPTTETTATTVAIIFAGALFGLAHIAGGPAYVLLALVAGIGYGWVYASTRSIGLAIATHAGLNTIHFFLFTYPALSFTV